MDKRESEALCELFTAYNAAFLGEGDTNTGANLLVAMAATLANVSRPGSGIWASGSLMLRVETNLIVSGGLSSSLVTDRVIRELAIRQNVVIEQMRRLIGDKIAEAKSERLKMVEFPTGPQDNASQNAIYQLEQKESLVPCNVLETWEEVLLRPPNPRIEDLAARPKVLVTAAGPKDLDRNLCGLHGHRPLVALSLKRPTDVAALADTCSGLLDSLLPDGEGGETVLGNLLVTDPGKLLAKSAPDAGDGMGWHERTVWLVDGDHGPDAREVGADEDNVRFGNMKGRFESALLRALAKRFNNHDAREVIHEFDLGPSQFRWVRYLQKMEPQIPGISGTARGLPGALAFGLIELAKAPNCNPIVVTPEGVEALARWVIERMANARAEMLHTADLEKRTEIARKIFFKVMHSPLCDRDIYRALSIQAAMCRELLSIMEEQGMLRCQEQKWRCVEGAEFSDSIRHRLALAA